MDRASEAPFAVHLPEADATRPRVAIPFELTSVHPWTFFLTTYLASWLIWMPLVASKYDVGPIAIPTGTSTLLGLVGVLMPATVAIVLTARRGGRAGVGRLLGRLRIWRVGWRWWAAAVVVPPTLLIGIGLAWAWAGGRPKIEVVDILSVGALVVNVVFLLIASLGEEIGWRGVALPGLEQRATALRASVILGLLWAGWHLPFWMLQDVFDQFGVGYLALDFLFIVPGTIYITWFFNHARFSILLPVAFHVVFNTVNVAWLPVTGVIVPFALLITGYWVLAALVFRRLDVPTSLTPRAGA